MIKPGEVQRMSAGTGVRHSEYNASQKDAVHFLQIWILPEKEGLPAGYEQRAFADAEKRGKLRLVASRDGRDGSVTVHQDVDLYASLLSESDKVAFDLKPGRNAWIQIARGQVKVNGELLKEGDGTTLTQNARSPSKAADSRFCCSINLTNRSSDPSQTVLIVAVIHLSHINIQSVGKGSPLPHCFQSVAPSHAEPVGDAPLRFRYFHGHRAGGSGRFRQAVSTAQSFRPSLPLPFLVHLRIMPAVQPAYLKPVNRQPHMSISMAQSH